MKLFEKKVEYHNNKKVKKYHVLGVQLAKRAKAVPGALPPRKTTVADDDFERHLSDFDLDKAEVLKAQILQQLEQINNNRRTNVRICYISCTAQNQRPLNDASTRYRCYHPAEALQNNVSVAVVTSLAAFIASPSYDYDIYVFHRPTCALKGFETIFNRLEQLDKILMADYDDLIFGDKKIALQSSIAVNKIKSRDDVIKIFMQNLQALKLFRYFSVSTVPLKNMILQYHPLAKVAVIHNFLPDSIFSLARTYNYTAKNKDKNLIMYCSGTMSHNQDFKLISDKILKLLNEDKSLRFYILGVLDIDSELSRHPRVFVHAPVNYWELFEQMQNAALTIAPLPLGSFNNCKSRVKFLESALSGATLLASPIPDMQEIEAPGIFLINKPHDWIKIVKNRHNIDFTGNSSANYDYLQKNCGKSVFLEEFSGLVKAMRG